MLMFIRAVNKAKRVLKILTIRKHNTEFLKRPRIKGTHWKKNVLFPLQRTASQNLEYDSKSPGVTKKEHNLPSLVPTQSSSSKGSKRRRVGN